MRSVRALLAGGCAVVIAVAGCSSGSGGGGQEELATGGTFTAAIAADPGNLDPMQAVLSATRGVLRYAYDNLVYLKSDGSITPWLAEKWDVTPNSVTYTLKEGITCSDGTPLTASDVAANFSYVADPANGSAYLGLQIAPGTTTTADDTARTVTVTAPATDAFLLQNSGTLFIECKSAIDDPTSVAKTTAGTGMFVLDEAVADDHYTFTKREDYTWGPDGITGKEKGLPDKVVLRVIPNQSTAANLMLSGDINLAVITGADRDRLEAQDLLAMQIRGPNGWLVFNQDAGHPGQDENVRKALTMALDLDQLGTVISDGNGIASQGLVTIDPNPCQADNVSGNLPKHDVKKAEALLDEAGWTKGSDGMRTKDGAPLAINFIWNSTLGDAVSAGAELLESAWKELGVAVTLSGQPPTGINTALFETGGWDAGFIPVGVAFPNWLVPFFSGATPPDGQNFSHIDNPDYVSLTTEASTLTGDESCAKWNEAEVALYKAVDVVTFMDNQTPVFGKNTTFEISGGELIPPTIRMLAA